MQRKKEAKKRKLTHKNPNKILKNKKLKINLTDNDNDFQLII